MRQLVLSHHLLDFDYEFHVPSLVLFLFVHLVQLLVLIRFLFCQLLDLHMKNQLRLFLDYLYLRYRIE